MWQVSASHPEGLISGISSESVKLYDVSYPATVGVLFLMPFPCVHVAFGIAARQGKMRKMVS